MPFLGIGNRSKHVRYLLFVMLFDEEEKNKNKTLTDTHTISKARKAVAFHISVTLHVSRLDIESRERKDQRRFPDS